jgi:hypothetical protein
MPTSRGFGLLVCVNDSVYITEGSWIQDVDESGVNTSDPEYLTYISITAPPRLWHTGLDRFIACLRQTIYSEEILTCTLKYFYLCAPLKPSHGDYQERHCNQNCRKTHEHWLCSNKIFYFFAGTFPLLRWSPRLSSLTIPFPTVKGTHMDIHNCT